MKNFGFLAGNRVLSGPGRFLGTPAQVAATAKAYRVYYQKDGKGEGYSVAHSSIVYLMNPDGKFDRALTESQTPAEVATQIGDAMTQNAKG